MEPACCNLRGAPRTFSASWLDHLWRMSLRHAAVERQPNSDVPFLQLLVRDKLLYGLLLLLLRALHCSPCSLECNQLSAGPPSECSHAFPMVQPSPTAANAHFPTLYFQSAVPPLYNAGGFAPGSVVGVEPVSAVGRSMQCWKLPTHVVASPTPVFVEVILRQFRYLFSNHCPLGQPRHSVHRCPLALLSNGLHAWAERGHL